MIPTVEQLQVGQRIPEYRIWLALCMQMRIQSYVELGSGAAHYLRQAGVPTVCSVDLNNEKGPLHNPHKERGVTYLAGDSHDFGIIHRVLEALGGPPECVFIDAGHDYGEVKADFDLWQPITTRLIGFHDIDIPDVRRFWEELCHGWPGGSVEIRARDIASARAWQGPGTSPDGRISGGGIGVLFKE